MTGITRLTSIATTIMVVAAVTLGSIGAHAAGGQAIVTAAASGSVARG